MDDAVQHTYPPSQLGCMPNEDALSPRESTQSPAVGQDKTLGARLVTWTVHTGKGRETGGG